MQQRDHRKGESEHQAQETVITTLHFVRGVSPEAKLPGDAPDQTVRINVRESLFQRVARQDEVEVPSRNLQGDVVNYQVQSSCVKEQRHHPLPAPVRQQAACFREFHVHVKQQRRQQAQARDNDGDRKSSQTDRQLAVINLGIENQKRSAVEKKQRQAREEENPLEVALPPIANNHDHPEQRKQRAPGQPDQSNVEKRSHKPQLAQSVCPRRRHRNGQVSSFPCTTVTNCK